MPVLWAASIGLSSCMHGPSPHSGIGLPHRAAVSFAEVQRSERSRVVGQVLDILHLTSLRASSDSSFVAKLGVRRYATVRPVSITSSRFHVQPNALCQPFLVLPLLFPVLVLCALD